MLRVNVGLSRKLSKDYNSTGYSVNLDGEITSPVSDPEGVIEQAKELFDLAEEVLTVQVERSQGVDAIARHDEEPQGGAPDGRNDSRPPASRPRPQQQSRSSGNGNGQNGEPATNKQIQYLLGIGKRQNLSTPQLEQRITEILGRPVGVYDLTKQAAGVVIDALTSGTSGNGATSRR